MATVQLADIYEATRFASGAQEDQIEKNRFIQGGIITGDPRVSAFAAGGSRKNEIAFMKPLGTPEPNYSNDVSADKSTQQKISGAAFDVRTAYQNQSWASMDLATEVALIEPIPAITSTIGKYWATTNERRLIASNAGVLADNIANNGGDMVNNESTTTGEITAVNRINSDNIIDTIQTMGDHGENLRVMAMHSAVYRQMQKDNLLDTLVPASEGMISIRTYQGKQIIVDDSLAPDLTVPTHPVYTVHMFVSGAYVGGEGMPKNASELDRDPDAGNGGGEDKLYSRRTDIIHPLGFSCVGTPANGVTLTLAELRLATTWSRVWERKSTGLAFLQVNV